MIQEVTGNMFAQPAKAYVNPVNCIGVMGKGLAAQFRAQHEGMFRAYEAMCKVGQMKFGTVQAFPCIKEECEGMVFDVPLPEQADNEDDAYAALQAYQAQLPKKSIITEGGYADDPIWVFNFPTMRYPGEKSKLINIRKGLKTLAEQVATLKVTSICIPAVGCGIGGLDWADVREEIKQAFANLQHVDVYIFPPQ